MTVDKGFEILQGSIQRNIPYRRDEIKAAESLGLEALERLKELRVARYSTVEKWRAEIGCLLPTETGT